LIPGDFSVKLLTFALGTHNPQAPCADICSND